MTSNPVSRSELCPVPRATTKPRDRYSVRWNQGNEYNRDVSPTKLSALSGQLQSDHHLSCATVDSPTLRSLGLAKCEPLPESLLRTERGHHVSTLLKHSMQVTGWNLLTKTRSGKIGHSRSRLAQKWPSGSVFVLVHNDDHPHPGMDATFPPGDPFGQRVGSCRGS